MVEAICTFHDHYLGFGEPNCNARLMEFFFSGCCLLIFTLSLKSNYTLLQPIFYFTPNRARNIWEEHSTGFAMVTLSKHCHGSGIACYWVAVDQSIKYTTFVSPQYFEYMKLRR